MDIDKASIEHILFVQWWTIELKKSLDDPHDEQEQIFIRGVEYAFAFLTGRDDDARKTHDI